MTYQEGLRSLPIYWELSTVVCVYPDFRCWPDAPNERISEGRQLEMLQALRAWFSSLNIKSSVDAPANLVEDTVLCHGRDCTRMRLINQYYCSYHYDLSCLARDPVSPQPSNNRWRVP